MMRDEEQNTNDIYETFDAQTKKKCNRGTALERFKSWQMLFGRQALKFSAV